VYDSNVPFWEPVKWVARLRRANLGQQPILLVTRRNADHDGPSGRSRRLRERAFEWAFLLHVVGRADDT
jgi:oligopeptidase B